jgi:hypothetical protein
MEEALSMLVRLSLVMLVMCSVAGRANAECSCVAVAGDVVAAIQAEVAKADGLYARGDFNSTVRSRCTRGRTHR